MTIPFSLVLDIFVAVLLIVMIGYAFTLNKRLGTLRRDKEELQKLALSFGDATLRAEDSTVQLRATIDVLQERIKKAESLRDDLVFLVERGNGTADALEELVRTARDKVGVMPGTASRDTLTDEEPMRSRESLASTSQSAPKAGAEALSNGDQMSDAERELLRALRSAS
ncbi:MAG: hypothetical protein CMF67_10345 [Magnetovibrio sp.]|nr:hypothetical protein [Magnetovibrio sp.]|tara:strand:+ start:28 stop:534 length:507 start_codon:yes stop_codon:yes gene_type:complete